MLLGVALVAAAIYYIYFYKPAVTAPVVAPAPAAASSYNGSRR